MTVENSSAQRSATDVSAVERALALGPQQLTGEYRIDLATGTWWWSDEAFLVHGFAPGEVVPTTELVLAHKHPEDRERVRRILDAGRRTGAPFSSVHRIMDARGRERTIAVVGQGRRDEEGDLVEIVGYFVDISAVVAERSDERATEQIAAAAATRGTIEQAKGVIAATYAIDPEEAFVLLRATSNDRNVRLREVAQLVVRTATASGEHCREYLDAVLGPRAA
ncbi:PAS and ANTAR domain-containing protein [Cellulosimicrobium sp. PMB13]|uniref:PAS and ANTAR domain-containing protein n=1 Tax=Cellulosimicrobium sp. PMB13 TaxID=3120158 RepID=UPI003F4B53D7